MVLARNRKTISGAPITYGKILSRMDLVGPPFARPSGADCHDISVAEEDRIGSLALRSDVRRSWDRGVGAVNFLGDKPSHGSARIPRICNGNKPRFERLLVLRWQKVVELRLTGQPGRRFPHECFSKPQFAEFMNLMRGNPRQSRQFAAADVCMAHWFHATDRACWL